jgi:hypothetical protein
LKPDEFYTIEELCILRRLTTRREKKAFYWFFGSFLDCVCGKEVWESAKYSSLVLEAATKDKTKGKIVTVSNKAFAFLLFDNYIDRWIEMAAAELAKKKEKKREAAWETTIRRRHQKGGE